MRPCRARGSSGSGHPTDKFLLFSSAAGVSLANPTDKHNERGAAGGGAARLITCGREPSIWTLAAAARDLDLYHWHARSGYHHSQIKRLRKTVIDLVDRPVDGGLLLLRRCLCSLINFACASEKIREACLLAAADLLCRAVGWLEGPPPRHMATTTRRGAPHGTRRCARDSLAACMLVGVHGTQPKRIN